MTLLAFARRISIGLAGTVAALAILAAASHASEVRAADAPPAGLVIHSADETLRDFCGWDGGALFLALPGGYRVELITSTSDPAILNPGDGAFHAFEPGQVKAAINEVRYPLRGIGADIFLLPYPRRDGLESAAGPGLILLAPGVRPLSAGHQHAEAIHELGHVVQYAQMPDQDVVRWGAYRRLRGISGEAYRADAPHADRPHEIFAEDFRALFGGALANYSGTIENPALVHPSEVPGLDAFLEDLAGTPSAGALAALSGFPNPSRGVVRFARRAGEPGLLDVFDVSGRRIASVLPSMTASGLAWDWDGRDASGRPVTRGVVFARTRDGVGGTARVTLLP